MDTREKTVFNALGTERNKRADQMHQLFLELGVDFVYGSCSEEKSMSDSACLDKLASDVGYQYPCVASATQLPDMKKMFRLYI